MFKILFLDTHTFALWGSALGLALLLRFIHAKLRHPLVVPFYFMIVPLIFYFVVYIFGFEWKNLRDDGWVFPLPGGNVPWWHYYTYYGKLKFIMKLYLNFRYINFKSNLIKYF
jgi:SulP family sulfate permease